MKQDRQGAIKAFNEILKTTYEVLEILKNIKNESEEKGVSGTVKQCR